MAKVRYTGNDTAFVPVINQEVEPDQVVELDDDVFKGLDWPETSWTVVEKKSTAKSKG